MLDLPTCMATYYQCHVLIDDALDCTSNQTKINACKREIGSKLEDLSGVPTKSTYVRSMLKFVRDLIEICEIECKSIGMSRVYT